MTRNYCRVLFIKIFIRISSKFSHSTFLVVCYHETATSYLQYWLKTIDLISIISIVSPSLNKALLLTTLGICISRLVADDSEFCIIEWSGQ